MNLLSKEDRCGVCSAISRALLIVAVLGLIAVRSPAAQDGTSASQQRLKERRLLIIARRILYQHLNDLGRTESKLSEKEISEYEQLILGSSKEHRTASRSRELVSQRLKDSIKKLTIDEIDRIAERTVEADKSPPLTKEELKVRLMRNADFDRKLNQAAEQFLTRNADRIFQQARKRAVAVQRSILDPTKTYPADEDEVEKLASEGWERGRTWKNLKKNHTDRMKKVYSTREWTPLEEIDIDGIAVSGLQSAKAQFAHQMSAVPQAIVAAGLLERQEIADGIRGHVTNAIARHQPNPGVAGKKYGLFPSVNKHIDARGASVEHERFVRTLSRRSYSVSSQTVRKLIVDDLVAHHETTVSFTKCLEHKDVWDVQADATVREHAAKRKSAVRRQNFQSRLRTMIDEDRKVKSTFSRLLKGALSPTHSQVRGKLVSEQFASQFRPLAERTTVFTETQIQTFQKEGAPKDFGEALVLVRALGIEPANIDRLLQETEGRVIAAVGELLTEGARGLNRQLAFVDVPWAPKIHREMEKDVLSQTKDEWIAQFTAKIAKDWKNEGPKIIWPRRAGRPPDYDKRYEMLFRSTGLKIEDVVGRRYDSIITAKVERGRKTLEPRQTRKADKDSSPADTGSGKPGKGGGEPGSGGGSGGWGGLLGFFLAYWNWLLLIILILLAIIAYLLLRRRSQPVGPPVVGIPRVQGLDALTLRTVNVEEAAKVCTLLFGERNPGSTATRVTFGLGSAKTQLIIEQCQAGEETRGFVASFLVADVGKMEKSLLERQDQDGDVDFDRSSGELRTRHGTAIGKLVSKGKKNDKKKRGDRGGPDDSADSTEGQSSQS